MLNKGEELQDVDCWTGRWDGGRETEGGADVLQVDAECEAGGFCGDLKGGGEGGRAGVGVEGVG